MFFIMGNMSPEGLREPYELPPSNTSLVKGMEDGGFHIGKLDNATLNTIESAGLSVKNAKNKSGENVVILNDHSQTITISKNITHVEVTTGIFQNIPHAVFVKLIAKDGTQVTRVLFAREQNNAPANHRMEKNLPDHLASGVETAQGEEQRDIILDNGKKIRLITKEEAKLSCNLKEHVAVIVDGKRYSVVPDYTMGVDRSCGMRSTFVGHGQRLMLYIPDTDGWASSDEKPSLIIEPDR